MFSCGYTIAIRCSSQRFTEKEIIITTFVFYLQHPKYPQTLSLLNLDYVSKAIHQLLKQNNQGQADFQNRPWKCQDATSTTILGRITKSGEPFIFCMLCLIQSGQHEHELLQGASAKHQVCDMENSEQPEGAELEMFLI